MAYIFKENIDPKIHDDFIQTQPLCNLLQSSTWAKVKDNWDNEIVGVYENDQLVGSSSVLIKKLPMNFTMMYIPRGPIMDYKNKELVKFYFDSLKKWAKKYHCLFIKLDPEIHIRDFTLDHKDMPYYENTEEYLKNITDAGAKHLGYTTYIAETIQPRFHMGVPKNDDMDKYIPSKTLRSKNVAVRKHVRVKEVGSEGLDEFAKVMHMTEERKAVYLRNEEYFQKLLTLYQDKAQLFLASVNPKERADELDQIIVEANKQLENTELGRKSRKKIEDELKQATDERSSMNELLEKYPSETVIAGGLMIGFGKVVEMLYAGMNDDFRTFRPQYLTYITQFENAFEHGYDYVTMGGVEGTLDDGLSSYKSAFNPTVNEFIGEFDLPVNGLLYKLSSIAFKMRKQNIN